MILEINIKNNKKEIQIVTDNKFKDVRYFYLDTYKNSSNYLSDKDSSHSFKFIGEDVLEDETNTKSTYSISAEDIKSNRITGLYILTAFFNDGSIDSKIIYDLNELYCLRVEYLTKTCVNCDETANMKKLTTLMFKEMLLRNTIKLNLIEDALKYYGDIFKCDNKNISKFSKSCSSGLCNL